MKLASSLLQFVPELEREVTEDNALTTCCLIAKSKYPSKYFTLASILTTLCDVGPRIWHDHVRKTIEKNQDMFENENTLYNFVCEYSELIKKVENACINFTGVPLGEPVNETI